MPTTNKYQILFYEESPYLYYISTEKEVIKMIELKDKFKPYYKRLNMTEEDYKLINSKFDIEQVYQEKILTFKELRKTNPLKINAFIKV